jgi:hypothetical protein
MEASRDYPATQSAVACRDQGYLKEFCDSRACGKIPSDRIDELAGAEEYVNVHGIQNLLALSEKGFRFFLGKDKRF